MKSKLQHDAPITSYKYNELSEESKSNARNWYREVSADDQDWSECVIDDAKDLGRVVGWTIEDIHWSGFWSQGDGACFTGTWYPQDVQPVEKLGIINDKLTRILEVFQGVVVTNKLIPAAALESVVVTHSSRNSHSHSVDFSFGWADEDEDDDDWTRVNNAEEHFRQAAQDFMDWIYRALEAEYEHINSDEYVVDAIECNDYRFDEQGEISHDR